jgi:tetratricopeptide (TPR) repeat protein
MKKLCLIYANCQNQLIARYLNRSPFFSQEYTIQRFPVHVLMQQKATVPDNVLKEAKLFIYQPVKDIHAEYSSQFIINKLSNDCQCISFPSLYFKGYFPQYFKNPANKVIKANYPHYMKHQMTGDLNVTSLFEQGKNVSEIIEILSDPDFYDREFLLANLHETLGELRRRETESDITIKASNFIENNYQHHYLFYTQNHPSDLLGLYVANQILKILQFPILEDKLLLHNRANGLLDGVQTPIYPSVIKHLNLTFMEPEQNYNHRNFATKNMTFTRYISEYVDIHCADSNNAPHYYFQGINFAKKGDFVEATTSLENAIKLKPDNAAYYEVLGSLLLKLNDLSYAESVYRKAIELSPDWEDFYKLLGDVLFKQRDFSAAQKFYEKAISINPSYKPYVYRCLGNTLEKLDSMTLAIESYKKAIEIDPTIDYFYSHLSSALTKQNQFEEAIDVCRQAIKLNNKDANYYKQLGNIQLQKGDIDDALEAYKQAIKLDLNQMTIIFPKLSSFIKEKMEKTMVFQETISEDKLVGAR